MSINCFLKCSKLKGSAKQEGHDGEVEVESVSWSYMQPVNRSGTGLSAGKAVPHGVTFTKHLDLSSTKLAQVGAAGEHLEELSFIFAKSGDNQKDYFTIKLKHAMVSSYQIGVNSGGDVTETISMEFKEISYEFKPQDDKGKVVAGGNFSWDTSKMVAKN